MGERNSMVRTPVRFGCGSFFTAAPRPAPAHDAVVLLCAAVLAVCISVTQLFAGEADVVDAKARQSADGSWRFDVTVRHADEGWDHYADLWQVIAPDGTVLGERVLAHPHVDEQPFTRSQSGIVIGEGTSTVTIRARDSVHEFGGSEMKVDVEAVASPG